MVGVGLFVTLPQSKSSRGYWRLFTACRKQTYCATSVVDIKCSLEFMALSRNIKERLYTHDDDPQSPVREAQKTQEIAVERMDNAPLKGGGNARHALSSRVITTTTSSFKQGEASIMRRCRPPGQEPSSCTAHSIRACI
ncbi:hypothetical protein EAG_06841 [Camponotus floridanus]|uniref:Uncharacterized protein n=1 Tax=Camponotus floridanus TaxID=104421 RepID=E2A1I4_CAMFO|nr:hypothetical protein EAG_06841 [Camponotus floridanus]